MSNADVTLAHVITIFAALAIAVLLPLLDQPRRDRPHEEPSGEIAKDHVIQIARHHRIHGSRGYFDDLVRVGVMRWT